MEKSENSDSVRHVSASFRKFVRRCGNGGSVVGKCLRNKSVLKRSNALRLHQTQGVALWSALQLALLATFGTAVRVAASDREGQAARMQMDCLRGKWVVKAFHDGESGYCPG